MTELQISRDASYVLKNLKLKNLTAHVAHKLVFLNQGRDHFVLNFAGSSMLNRYSDIFSDSRLEESIK